MIKIENTEVFGWEAAIRGMRNPTNSWEKSDSDWNYDCFEYDFAEYRTKDEYEIGPNDHDLMMRLVKAGDEHSKFMRMIHVSMDIFGTALLVEAGRYIQGRIRYQLVQHYA